MNISRITIKKVVPKKGLVGFVSMVIDDWMQLGNIAIFTRLNSEGQIRLVFPQKKINNKDVMFIHPLDAAHYFELEKAVLDEFNSSKE